MAHQQGAWEDVEIGDEIPEDGLRSAIGTVTGTESSARVELLVGVRHQPHIEDSVRCEEGASSVSVRFKVMEDSDMAELEEMENEIILGGDSDQEERDSSETDKALMSPTNDQ